MTSSDHSTALSRLSVIAAGTGQTAEDVRGLLKRLTAAEAALNKAADQFAFYADEHAKKGTKEGDAKGMTNMRWARFCARVGDYPPPTEASGSAPEASGPPTEGEGDGR